MKKKIKVLAFSLSVLMLLSAFSVHSAYGDDYTEQTDTYYMNGYRMYGHISGDSDSSTAATFCENITYGKRVAIVFHCYIDGNAINYTSDTNTYAVNGFDTLAMTANHPSRPDKVGWAEGKHWVKASEHMYWSSDDCEDNSMIGIEEIVW